MISFGEFAPDISDTNTNVSTEANNVIAGANSYTPLQELQAQTNALDAKCEGAITMKDSQGNNYIYAGDQTKLYSISGATVTDESKVGGYTSNGEQWSFVKWGENVIGSKFGDTPQILALGSSTFADLGGSPPQGKTMDVVRDFIVLGNTWDSTDNEKSNRVWWSGFNSESDWTSGINQSDFQDIQGSGGQVQRIIGGEYGIVFQERSIQRMTYVGTPLVFQFDEVEPERGTPAPRSVVQDGSDAYYLAEDGFYVLRNGQSSEPIGMNKVDKWFRDNLNTNYYKNITGAKAPDLGYIAWSFPSTQSTDGTPDRLIVFNKKTRKWSTGTVSMQLLFQGAASAYTLEDLDTFGNMDTLTASLDSPIWQGGAFKLAAFNTENKLSFFSGDVKTGTIETGEIFTDGYLTQLDEVRGVIDGNYSITVETRDRLTDTPATATGTPDSTGKVDFRTDARYHRIKMETSGSYTHASGVEVEQRTTGTR